MPKVEVTEPVETGYQSIREPCTIEMPEGPALDQLLATGKARLAKATRKPEPPPEPPAAEPADEPPKIETATERPRTRRRKSK